MIMPSVVHLKVPKGPARSPRPGVVPTHFARLIHQHAPDVRAGKPLRRQNIAARLVKKTGKHLMLKKVKAQNHRHQSKTALVKLKKPMGLTRQQKTIPGIFPGAATPLLPVIGGGGPQPVIPRGANSSPPAAQPAADSLTPQHFPGQSLAGHVQERKLVFYRNLPQNTGRAPARSTPRHNASSGRTLAPAVKSLDVPADLATVLGVENPGKNAPNTAQAPLPSVLRQSVQRGILQKSSGGWVVKPLHWKAPSGINATKWSLTLPKRAGSVIMTLIHMQKSWKVDMEVSAPGLAGVLAENLGQTATMTAAALPVSQVSVFVGLGQNQTGQGGGPGAQGSSSPGQSPSPHTPHRPTRAPSSLIRPGGFSSPARIDYQA